MCSKISISVGISCTSYLPQFHPWTFSSRVGSKVLYLTSARVLAQHSPVRVCCICFGQLENKTWKQILLESVWKSHRAPCPSCWQLKYFSSVYSHCGFHWPAWHGFPRSLRRPVHRPLACIIFSMAWSFPQLSFIPLLFPLKTSQKILLMHTLAAFLSIQTPYRRHVAFFLLLKKPSSHDRWGWISPLWQGAVWRYLLPTSDPTFMCEPLTLQRNLSLRPALGGNSPWTQEVLVPLPSTLVCASSTNISGLHT